MAAEMTNIDIREFTTLSGTDGEDSVLLVQESGANGKIKDRSFQTTANVTCHSFHRGGNMVDRRRAHGGDSYRKDPAVATWKTRCGI